MTEQKKPNKIFSGAVIGLSIVIIVATFGLGGWIYKRVLKDLAVRAKCPPSVVGVNQAHFTVTAKAVVKRIPKSAKVLDLWLPYPETKNNQIITNVIVKSPYPVHLSHEKEYGNAILHARVKNPKRDFEVSINFGVIRSENMAAKFIDRNVYQLKDAGDFAIWKQQSAVGLAPGIKSLAGRLTQGRPNSVDKAKAIYDYLAQKYIYAKGSASRKNSDAGSEKLAASFTVLARAVGVPVKHTAGYTMRGRQNGRIETYNSWVDFFGPGYGWIPADLATAKKFPQDTEYYFGNTDEWRVELVAGQDLMLEPPQRGPRISAWIDPYAEVDGKVFPVGNRVSWVKEFE